MLYRVHQAVVVVALAAVAVAGISNGIDTGLQAVLVL
jgi:hypothetical protein